MDILARLKLRTGESNDDLLLDIMETAKYAILSRRFPFGNQPDEVEQKYQDLQFRICLDLYNKAGAEGQTSHTENGISRTYESSWISEQLLSEVMPLVGGMQ